MSLHTLRWSLSGQGGGIPALLSPTLLQALDGLGQALRAPGVRPCSLQALTAPRTLGQPPTPGHLPLTPAWPGLSFREVSHVRSFPLQLHISHTALQVARAEFFLSLLPSLLSLPPQCGILALTHSRSGLSRGAPPLALSAAPQADLKVALLPQPPVWLRLEVCAPRPSMSCSKQIIDRV